MIGGEVADRVGAGGVAGELEGLAAAAASSGAAQASPSGTSSTLATDTRTRETVPVSRRHIPYVRQALGL